MAEMLGYGKTDEWDCEDVTSIETPSTSNSKFWAANKSIQIQELWECAEEFLRLNDPVLSAIRALSGGSALLSDACMAYLTTDVFMQNITVASFPRVLSGSSSKTLLTTSWEIRAQNIMGDPSSERLSQ
jgi:hypothetical protein